VFKICNEAGRRERDVTNRRDAKSNKNANCNANTIKVQATAGAAVAYTILNCSKAQSPQEEVVVF
jgi:hypothetical protein